MTMQAVYTKFEERHRDLLREEARQRGCTISDLVRQATIAFFHLPTDGPFMATMEQNDEEPLDVTGPPANLDEGRDGDE